jgi:hypothetical protein
MRAKIEFYFLLQNILGFCRFPDAFSFDKYILLHRQGRRQSILTHSKIS